MSTALARAFRRVASTAYGSTSSAQTGSCPSRRAAMASTPEPQPTSRTGPAGSPASSSRQSRVVACCPVPKAMPGSITTSASPGRGGVQGGRTQSTPATSIGWWKARSAARQSVRSGAASTSTGASAPRRPCSSSGAGARSAGSQKSRATRPSPSGRSRQPAPRSAHASASTSGASSARVRTVSRTSSAEGVLEAVEEALVLAVALLVEMALGQLRDRGPPLLARHPRSPDVDDHPLVAAAAAVEDREALAAQHDLLAGLGPRANLDALLLRDRRHRDLGAQHGVGHRDREPAHHVEAVALEPRVRRHPDLDVQVARRRAAVAGVPAAGQADALAVRDPGRDPNLVGLLLNAPPPP